jgi:DNA repair exonuclease SbcCD ATPase subunit
MNESIKNNFLKWVKTLDENSLSETDKQLINIFIDNLDALIPLGTNGGLRAKKLVDLIELHKYNASTNLPELNLDSHISKESIERIVEFIVGPFRGFSTSEIINFDNNFVFLYGPNGSGKSSFCEGLEFALLGNIWEATAKRIGMAKYIQNSITKKAELPIAYYKNADGKKKPIQKDQEMYQFSFIEKNRIDGFARITAVPPDEQKDRIATLFGLDAFSDFVDNFTDNFQNYLSINTPLKNEFSSNSQYYEQKKLRLFEIEKERSEISNELALLIKNIGVDSVVDKETMKLFLLGGVEGVSGIINQLQIKKVTAIPDDIKIDGIDNYTSDIDTLYKSIKELENDMAKFFSLSSNIKYNELYNAISAIDKDKEADKTICPACKTPISETVINPFVNAQIELQTMKELSSLQECIPINAREISQQTRNIRQSAYQISSILTNLGSTIVFSSITEVDYINIETIPTWLKILSNEVEIASKEFSQYDILKQSCERYNASLLIQRTEQLNIDAEIQKYNNFHETLIKISTIENKLNIEEQNITDAIKQLEETNKEVLINIENEQKNVEVNQNYIGAYSKLIKSLKNHRNSLPALFSTGLADKAKDYYNIINSHDPEFDKIESLILPTKIGEKIMIQFSGSSEKHDALYILSEGHIKILGLSILLAKVVAENLKVIIFDDIVNAIDDEHKDGIADLLLGHTDMTNRQLILTCHGDQFVNKLEHKLGASRSSKEVIRYRFFPMDSIPTRTIKISIGDAKHYLLQAKEALDRDDRKGAAFKCRQATESVSQSLWKKLGKELNINLSVSMRTPTAEPDLYSIVNSLIKELEKIDKDAALLKLLKELKEKYPWSLLNKGTHEGDLPEFDRTDISSLIAIITNIEKLVASLKLVITVEALKTEPLPEAPNAN